MTLTLQELLCQALEAQRARRSRADKWRADEPVREAKACDVFRDYMIDSYYVALGDDVELSAEELHDPEPSTVERRYRIDMWMPALDGGVEVTVVWSPGMMERDSMWFAHTSGGTRQAVPTLEAALLWLSDNGRLMPGSRP